MAKRAPTPWWLSAGTESCHVCTHSYIHEIGIYCVECDRGVCIHCMVVEMMTREPYCPVCYASERGD